MLEVRALSGAPWFGSAAFSGLAHHGVLSEVEGRHPSVHEFPGMKIDVIYMSEALKQARRAFDLDEVPVGAIVVYKRRIIARAHNQTRLLKDPTAHAELIALTQTANFLKTERLLICTLYVTIEPCAMCAGAMLWARIRRLVFGAADPKTGSCGSVIDILGQKRFNHRISLTRGILAADCGSLMSEFFRRQRAQGKK